MLALTQEETPKKIKNFTPRSVVNKFMNPNQYTDNRKSFVNKRFISNTLFQRNLNRYKMQYDPNCQAD